jgi:glycosyltransferase involved in cell wall biosynthesis
MKFSVVIPARNEECFIGKCLDSIERASKADPSGTEVIVVLNRCTDSTEKIARARGAKIVTEDSKCLARIRNKGAMAASGEIILTIDADSRMSENMLCEIDRALKSGKYVGGGVPIRPERMSVGIGLSMIFLNVTIGMAGLAGGLYWCYRRDFEAVGGFNEQLIVAEDLDFAKRLKAYGKLRGQKFIRLRGVHIVTSARKFDHFGDWIVFKTLLLHGRDLRKALLGTDTMLPDRYFYEFEHQRFPVDTGDKWNKAEPVAKPIDNPGE